MINSMINGMINILRKMAEKEFINKFCIKTAKKKL